MKNIQKRSCRSSRVVVHAALAIAGLSGNDGFSIVQPQVSNARSCSSRIRNSQLRSHGNDDQNGWALQTRCEKGRLHPMSSRYSSVSSSVYTDEIRENKGSRQNDVEANSLQRTEINDTFDPFGFAAQTSDKGKIDGLHENPAASFFGESSPEVLKARALVLIAAALYGTNFTLVKILNEHLPVGASTSLRFVLASLALLPFFFMKGDEQAKEGLGQLDDAVSAPFDLKSTLPVVLAGMEVGFYNSIGYIAQAFGLQTTDASKSAFICSLAVVIVPIFDLLSRKTKSMSLSTTTGILLAVCGVGLLELGGAGGDFNAMMHLSTGDIFTFVQPLFFGFGFIRMENAMRKFPTEAKRLTAAQLLMVAIVSVFNCWVASPMIVEWFPSVSLAMPPTLVEMTGWLTDPLILGALIWTGIVTTAITIYLETLALQTLSAAEATLLFSTEPLWGAGFASVVGGERLGAAAMAGAGLILSGCVVSTAGQEEGNEETLVEEETSSPLLPGLALASAAVPTKVMVELRRALDLAMESGTAADASENILPVMAPSKIILSAVMSLEIIRQLRWFSETTDP
jgi:drug/metabolite transporter (DMT)-like permease